VYNTLLDLYLRGDEEVSPGMTMDVKFSGNNYHKERKTGKGTGASFQPTSIFFCTLYKLFQATYDPGTALILCQMQDFKRGQLCLYEKLMLYVFISKRSTTTRREPKRSYQLSYLCFRYNEILQHYMDIDDYANVVKTCRKYSYVIGF
jgi:hypothetical protein